WIFYTSCCHPRALHSFPTRRSSDLVFTRWEGVELMNYSPLIYAFEQENVAVTGAGVLDGQANSEVWWPWKGQGRRAQPGGPHQEDRKSTRLNSSHVKISYAVFCLKK